MSKVHFLPDGRSARIRLPIHGTAAVIGVEPHIVRQWLAKPFFGDRVQGLRQGRERRLDVGEATLLRLLAEHLPFTGSLKESWAAVAGLVQAIGSLSEENELFPLDMFAVETWNGLGSAKQIDRLICLGRTDLARCVAEQTVGGRTHVYFINISNILTEVSTGWDIATLGPEEARREFERVHLARLVPTRHAQALATFAELERRIVEKQGPVPAREKPWATWNVPANAA